MENIIELETTYNEICQTNNMKSKTHLIKSPFNRHNGPLNKKKKRPKSKRILGAIKNVVQDGVGVYKSAKTVRKSMDNITGKAGEIYHELKSGRADPQQALEQGKDAVGTFMTDTKALGSNLNKFSKNFSFNKTGRSKLPPRELEDEKVKYQKEVRTLMNELRSEY